MAQNEKIQMLLDMQEHPENYSEEALETMLEDPEVCELMEATAQLKQAMTWADASKNTADTDAEWQRFVKAHLADSAPRRGWLKVAASFIGVLLVSGMAFAAIHIVRHVAGGDSKASAPETQAPNSHQPIVAADTVKSDTVVIATPVVFDNVTLDSIARDIAAYHHVGMDLQNDQARQLRFYFVWKQDDSLQEVIEKLNMFEHVDMTVEDGKLIIR